MAQLPGDSIHDPALPTHFMWLQSVQRQVSVYFENQVLAVTFDALRVIEVGSNVLEPALYLPLTDICAELRPNEKTTYCDLKGTASYFDLLHIQGGVAVVDAAWAYRDPLEIAAPLKFRVAFDCSRFAVEAAPL